MNKSSDQLRNQLREDAAAGDSNRSHIAEPPDDHAVTGVTAASNKPRKRPLRNALLVGVIVLAVVSMFRDRERSVLNPFNWFSGNPITSLTGPSEELLNAMQASLIDMGYGEIAHDELRALRRDGLTATYVENVRGLGYTELSIPDAVRLVQADASSAFIAMMQELGYTLSVDDMVNLRRAEVTAHYTSNIHDLGYREVTIDQLIRMRRIGVTPALVQRLQAERGADIPLEDIIRYRISNQ